MVTNSYKSEHKQTITKEEYFPSFVYENSILECRVVDLPVINQFPSSSDDEWMNYRHFGLLSADAYLLVYDLSTPSSFHFLQVIRDQIAMSRGLGKIPIVVAANKMDLVHEDLTQDCDREVPKPKHNFSTKVKKAWKLNHVECSAKYNWNVNTVFRELGAEILAARNGGCGGNSRVEKRKCCLICI